MKNLFFVIAISGLIFNVAACGNKSSDDAKKQTENNLKGQGDASIKTASYASDCSSDKYEFAKSIYPGTVIQYDLSDIDFTKKELHYSDDCKSQVFLVQEIGKINEVRASSAVNGAFEKDFNFERTTVTITNEKTVEEFNAVKACGFSDWALNVEKDVSRRDNASPIGQFLCPGKPSPRVAQEIVLIEGTNMYLGANADQDASKGRPGQIDRSKVFKKR